MMIAVLGQGMPRIKIVFVLDGDDWSQMMEGKHAEVAFEELDMPLRGSVMITNAIPSDVLEAVVGQADRDLTELLRKIDRGFSDN